MIIVTAIGGLQHSVVPTHIVVVNEVTSTTCDIVLTNGTTLNIDESREDVTEKVKQSIHFYSTTLPGGTQ